MGKLFGTDGVRGVAGRDLNAQLAYKIGLCTSHVLISSTGKKPRILIGKDTRISGDMLECAIAAGLCANGCDVTFAGVLPTPAVAYLVTQRNFDAGIMISASHNTSEYNGIKIFNAYGMKLSDELEEKIELAVDDFYSIPQSEGQQIGRTKTDFALKDLYIANVKKLMPPSLSGFRLIVDCANGSAAATAPEIFEGAQIICADPDGLNINDRCGSTHLDKLAEKVIEGHFDLGIAFDGDADRCLMVDEQGHLIDGDQIMSVIALDMAAKDILKNNTITATVMSNMGLQVFAAENGLKVVQTAVGDRYVLEEMLRCGYNLGGEQSGHVILTDRGTTGDGQVTAAEVLSILASSDKPASELFAAMKVYPQVIQNVKVTPAGKANVHSDEDIANIVTHIRDLLQGKGRVLLRPSGTEPLVRVMIEGENKEEIEKYVRDIVAIVKKKMGI